MINAVWRIAGPGVKMQRFDGDAVVFNPLSGHTHFVDVVGAELLAALIEHDCSVAALCARAAELLEVEIDERLFEHLRGILSTLDRLSLVEPASA